MNNKHRPITKIGLCFIFGHPIPGREHPRYWANFVLIGDPKPLKNGFPWVWVLLLAGVLGLGLIWKWRP